MIRVLLFFFGVAALAFGVVWLAERPGDIAVNWLGYRVETSVMVGVGLLALALAAAILLWSIFWGLLRAPGAFARNRRSSRTSRAYRAISRGIVAIGAGDADSARRFANEARRLMPHEPLALLLGAQTAQLAGDSPEAERTFRAMASRHDTRHLGLHGLFIEAQRRGDAAAARAYAEEAVKLDPTPAWAGEAVLQARCGEEDWAGALAALEANLRNGLVDKDVYKRQRAVLLTGRALSGEDDRATAKDLALQALKLCPGLVPAAALAGRLLADDGLPRKAARAIETAWAINPHPDLARAYADLRPGQSSRERYYRIRSLARIAPKHPESGLAVARAAIDAQEFRAARSSLAPFLDNPTQRVAALMAELEERENGDIGRSREWMARALSAARDPAWTADGLVSNTWMPASPASGRLDAFEWRIPVADLGPHGPVIEHDHLFAPRETRINEDYAPAGTSSEPAPSAAADAAQRSAAAKSDEVLVEPVVPLVHTPDDPGPEPDSAAKEPKRESTPWYYR